MDALKKKFKEKLEKAKTLRREIGNPISLAKGIIEIPGDKADKYMDELRITREAVLRAMKLCPTARDVLRILFPDRQEKQTKSVVATEADFLRCGQDSDGVTGRSREVVLTNDFLTGHKFTKITFEWEE